MTLANGTTYLDSVARYECDPDYWLEGSDTRTCLKDARWTGTRPYCIREYQSLSSLFIFRHFKQINFPSPLT